jgi:hypothetical protein
MEDLFLIKYDLDGDEQWLMEAGGNNNDVANGVVADESGVYFVGTFYGSGIGLTDAGAGTALNLSNASNGDGEIMIVRYDINGTLLWGQTVSGPGRDDGLAITMDNDSLYITGAIEDNASFSGYAGNPLSASAFKDIFLASMAKTDTCGEWPWPFIQEIAKP